MDEIVVLATTHTEQIDEYLKASKWSHSVAPKVTLMRAEDCQSVGDALRTLDQKEVIKVRPPRMRRWAQPGPRRGSRVAAAAGCGLAAPPPACRRPTSS